MVGCLSGSSTLALNIVSSGWVTPKPPRKRCIPRGREAGCRVAARARMCRLRGAGRLLQLSGGAREGASMLVANSGNLNNGKNLVLWVGRCGKGVGSNKAGASSCLRHQACCAERDKM